MANTFEMELAESAKVYGIYYQKLCVPMRVDKWQNKGKVGFRTVMLKDNPYDSFIVHKGTFVALELKSQRYHGSFSFNGVKPHQVEGLLEAEKNGGVSFILINMRRVKKKELKKGSPKNQAWAISVTNWIDLMETVDRKSIAYDLFELDRRIIEIPRNRGVDKVTGKYHRYWDIRELLNEYA